MRVKYVQLLYEHVIKDHVSPSPSIENMITTQANACPNCTCESCVTYYNGPKTDRDNGPKTDRETGPNADRETSLPTEARLRQKERLKSLKEQGKKPGKRKKNIEPGNDDW